MDNSTKKPTLAFEIDKNIKEANKQKIIEHSNIPRKYWDIGKIDIDDGNKEAIKSLASFVSGNLNGLLLSGKTGTGKTLIACKAVLDSGLKAKYISVPKLLFDLRANFNSKNNNNKKIVEELLEQDLVVLDDLGAEKTSDWVSETLYIIINGLYENMKKIIVTTNCNSTELIEKAGPRIVSRLMEMTKVVKISSKDRRIK